MKITLSEKIVQAAQAASENTKRSVAEQLEHWIAIGQEVEANSDLTYEFIKKILIARQEAQAGQLEPYTISLD